MGAGVSEVINHTLKSQPASFREIAEGRKNFDLRRDDREFKVGDIVLLREYDPEKGYTGFCLYKDIKYVTNAALSGLAEGYCIVGY